MKLRYSNSMEDLIAFHLFHLQSSASQQKVVSNARWTLVGLGMVCCLALSFFEQWLLGLAVAVAGIVVALFYPSLARWTVVRQAKRIYSDGDTKGLIGPHELELAPPDLIERTPVNENRRWLGAIEKVGNTPTHTFIYDSAVSAYAIPRAAVTDGDHDAFVEALQREIQAAKRDAPPRV